MRQVRWHVLSKGNDILDVWLDSGCSRPGHARLRKTTFPGLSDLYLEGGDQFRGWFHSSLLIGVGLKGESPYRNCARSGLDPRRRGSRDAQVQGQCG